MLSGLPVLVIGAAAVRDSIARALPHADLRWYENPLQGVWVFGADPCETVIVSLDIGAVTPRVIESLRNLSPDARILLHGQPHQEPIARHMLSHGATDYLLEPIARDELMNLFGQPFDEPAREGENSARLSIPSHSDPPGETDLHQLSMIVQSLGDGPALTLERLCNWMRRALRASFLAIKIDELEYRCGEPNGNADTAEFPIHRNSNAVGHAVLKFHRSERSPVHAQRITEFIRLAEACLAQSREQHALRELAWTDHLTGLRNRRFFEESLARLAQQATADCSRITLFLFDIDNFKTYNDRLGYETGDALLREVGALLTRTCRAQDIVARFGGDEFAVVFWDAETPRSPGSTHPTDPTFLAGRFQQLFREHRFHCLGPHAPATVTISGGLASSPRDGRTAGELIRAAESALRAAKQSGKNRIQIAASNHSDTV